MRRTTGQVQLFEVDSHIEVVTFCFWYAINNSKHGATGVIFNRSRFSEFEKFMSRDRAKN